MNENPEDTADERDSRRSFLDEVTARPREIDVAMEERYVRGRGRIRFGFDDFFKMICI